MKEWKLRFSVLLPCVCLFASLPAAEPEPTHSDERTDSLKEIVVTSKQFVRTPNGLTVIPDKEQTRHASSGFGLVRNLMIPGLSVNATDGTISSPGGTVKIYIDGMEADIREVRQLRPADVARVQYMDNPTGRYAGDKAALNFILRKRTSGGYIGIDALQRIGYANGDYNLSAKFFDRNTQYTLFAGSDFKNIRGDESYRDDEILFPDGNTIERRYSSLADKSRKNSQYGQFRIRNKNDRRTLRATLNVVRSATPEKYSSSQLKYSGPESATAESFRNETSRGLKYNLGLSGTFKLPDNQTIDASASGSISKNDYSYSYTEGEAAISSTAGEDLYSFSSNLNYVKTFRRGNSLSVKFTELYNVSSSDYRGNHPSWQHLWMSESILFAEYTHNLWGIARLSLSPGVSAQFYRLHGQRRVSNVSPRAQMTFAIQPSPAHSAQFVAAYGNSYPQLSMLTETVTQVDRFHVRRGNPTLKQSRIFGFMALYGMSIGKFNLQLSGQYMGCTRLPMAEYSISDGMLVESWQGNGRWNMVRSQLSATWMPSKKFNAQLTGGWLHNCYEACGHLSASCWYSEATLSWYTGDFAINARMASPQRTAGYDRNIVRTVWSCGVSASWAKGNLLVEAGIDNPFLKRQFYKYSLDTMTYRSYSRQSSKTDRMSAFIKGVYTLDFGKKTSHDSRNIDKNIDSGILRAQ